MMTKRMMVTLGLTLVLLADRAGAQETCTANDPLSASITSTRSITYYYHDKESCWQTFDLVRFDRALAGMQQLGANTVWLVIPWKDFQPSVFPAGPWNRQALINLRQAVWLAQRRGMKVVLPLIYFGKNWSPEGVVFDAWILDDKTLAAFENFVVTLMSAVGPQPGGVFYMLHTEGSEPLLETARENPLATESFRQWCQAQAPGVAHWNARWETQYTWDQVLPIDYKDVQNNKAARWDDHWRWIAWLMREKHGPLARRLRTHLPQGTRLGYHDHCLVARDWARGQSPIPQENPYDFLSFALYYKPKEYGSLEDYERELQGAYERFAEQYPGVPLMIGEAGACAEAVGVEMQAQVVERVADFCLNNGLGLNLWMWQDFAYGDRCEGTFGLLDVAGQPKPSYQALRAVWPAGGQD